MAIVPVSWPAAGDRSGSTRAGPLQLFLVTGEPVAIEAVGGPAAGDRSGSTRAGPLQPFLVTGAAGGHRAGGAGQQLVIGQGN
ncbi:hypothetical protein, partial [Aeromonas sp. 700722]